MSDKFKLKYEVIAILRDNIIMGMSAFGLPMSETAGDGGWIVMESDQPSMRNADKVVLFWLEKTERQTYGREFSFNKESGKFDDTDNFIEQQHWKIKILCRRDTKPVSDDDIPIMTEDVASMLAAWFHRHGCDEFRKHNMSNLYVQLKDMKTYKDPSDVNQWATEFVLKLNVRKSFTMEVDTAEPDNVGMIQISGYGKQTLSEP